MEKEANEETGVLKKKLVSSLFDRSYLFGSTKKYEDGITSEGSNFGAAGWGYACLEHLF
jgi:hypothetical protein